MYLPIIDELYNVDLIIMGLGFMNTTEDNSTNFQRDNIRIINDLKPKKVLFTHIEEFDGLNFDDYKKLEQKYNNLEFAYDGMNTHILKYLESFLNLKSRYSFIAYNYYVV